MILYSRWHSLMIRIIDNILASIVVCLFLKNATLAVKSPMHGCCFIAFYKLTLNNEEREVK